MIKKLTLFVLFLVFVISIPKVEATTYYVDGANLGGACNDTNNGTALTTPWCTLTKAATTVVGGDIVNVRGATYRETATLSNSGSSGSPIIFQKYLSESPIVNGADIPSTWISLGNSESGGLFNSGFETGDFSDFTSTTIDASNTTTVQSSVVNHGLYAMKTVYGGTAANSRANKNVTASNDLYARIYFQMAAGFDLAATGSRFDILYIKKDSTTNLARASIVKNGSNSFSIQGRIEAPTGSAYSASTFYSGSAGEITTGTWYYLELRYKGQDAATGGAAVFLSGVSKGSVLNLNTTGVNNTPARIEVGGSSSSATVPTSGSILYIDDTKTDTSAVGAFVPEGNANIYKAQGVNWTVRDVYEDANALTAESSLSNVNAAGEWYVDTVANILYVWSSNNASPGTHTTEAARRNSGFDISSRNYITINGFSLKYHNNTSFGAIHLSGSNNNTVSNSTITDNLGPGIFLNNSSTNTISNNQLLRNRRQFGGGLRLENGSSSNTVSQNTITGTGLSGGNGISLCGDSTCNSTGNNSNTLSRNTISNVYDTCMYLDTNNDSNVIERNICHDVYRTTTSSGGNGFHLSLGSDSNIIRNNIVYNTQRHGISLRDGNVSQGYVNNNNNVIYNNTVYNIGYGGGGFGESGDALNVQGTNSNNIIKNNIAYQAKDAVLNIEAGSVSTTTSDYNLLYNPSGTVAKYNGLSYSTLSSYQSASGQDAYSRSADPLFENIGAYNFALTGNSPAINAGATLASVTEDIIGTARPYSTGFDIGAYESLVVFTPTPTASGTSSTSSGSSSSASDSQPPKSCNDTRPGGAAQLFQIVREAKTATLFITPGDNPYTKFIVFYGVNENTNQYSSSFEYRHAKGVISYTVRELDPSAAYSFKVQVLNGCRSGDFSNTLKAGVSRIKKSFYQNQKVSQFVPSNGVPIKMQPVVSPFPRPSVSVAAETQTTPPPPPVKPAKPQKPVSPPAPPKKTSWFENLLHYFNAQ